MDTDNKEVEIVSQTGSTNPPTQVENVQYKAVRSKIGVATLFTTFCLAVVLWSINFIISSLLTVSILTTQNTVIFGLSLLIPFTGVFIYAYSRFRSILATQPSTVDDIFFKRTIRTWLIIGAILFLFNCVAFIYSLLTALTTAGSPISAAQLFAQFVSVVLLFVFSYFCLHYQRMTTR